MNLLNDIPQAPMNTVFVFIVGCVSRLFQLVKVDHCCGVMDIDQVVIIAKFLSFFQILEPMICSSFNKFLKKSGSVVSVSDCIEHVRSNCHKCHLFTVQF